VTKTKLRTPKNRELRASDTGPTATQAEVDNLALRRRCHVAAGIVAVVMVGIVCVLSATNLMWPSDSYSDINILVSGKNLATHGLLSLHMLPVHYPTPTTENAFYYLHYPPLPDVINCILQSLGITHLAAMRMITGLLFISGLLCMYWAFSWELGPLAAVCGLAFLATSAYFVSYAVSLHQHAYNAFVLGLFLLFLTRAVRTNGFRRKPLMACWAILMVGSLASYEFILYCQIFAWVYVLASGQIRRHWRSLLILATAPMVGVGLHFLQNCWAVGLAGALTDGLGYGQYLEKGRWHWLKQLPDLYFSRTGQRFYWPWPALLALGTISLVLADYTSRSAEPRRRASALLLALTTASLGWYLFMPRHAAIHEHTMNQLFPLAFAVMGCTIALIGQWLLKPGQSLPGRLLAALVLLVFVGGQARTITTRLDEWKPSFGGIIEAIGPDALPEKAAIVSNIGLEPHMGYFLQRPFCRAPRYDRSFPECLPEFRTHLPEDWTLNHYVFAGNRKSEPFMLLASTCPGRRLSVAGMTNTMIVLFDISQLHLPPDQRKTLPSAQREKQLRSMFEEWVIPGFNERLKSIYAQFRR